LDQSGEQDKESFEWVMRFVDVLQTINVRLVTRACLILVTHHPAQMH
jgi:hypothetical protein